MVLSRDVRCYRMLSSCGNNLVDKSLDASFRSVHQDLRNTLTSLGPRNIITVLCLGPVCRVWQV